VNPPNQPAWENLIRLAEIEPDLDGTRDHAERAELAIFHRSLELVHSPEESEEKEALRAAANRLLRVRTARLKRPAPSLERTKCGFATVRTVELSRADQINNQ
jgi:hypothetical protein